MIQTIYRYGGDFDKDVILDNMAELDDKIEDEKDKNLSKERDDRVRKLMYAKFIQGLKLCTGYNYF